MHKSQRILAKHTRTEWSHSTVMVGSSLGHMHRAGESSLPQYKVFTKIGFKHSYGGTHCWPVAECTGGLWTVAHSSNDKGVCHPYRTQIVSLERCAHLRSNPNMLYNRHCCQLRWYSLRTGGVWFTRLNSFLYSSLIVTRVRQQNK